MLVTSGKHLSLPSLFIVARLGLRTDSAKLCLGDGILRGEKHRGFIQLLKNGIQPSLNTNPLVICYSLLLKTAQSK